MKQTREEIIDLFYKIKALEEKAACREVNCDILDKLTEAADKMNEVWVMTNEIIVNND